MGPPFKSSDRATPFTLQLAPLVPGVNTVIRLMNVLRAFCRWRTRAS
ncbi:hypothetical protein AB4Y32_05520 [Paraburkholderia phymatum]|uniref:Uncharacterized protein n=1 Tax=Paraburkholderia phymatum TaxID=148447 RepID=A0ACC6TV89_9BURK